jgi:hypothetical protein
MYNHAQAAMWHSFEKVLDGMSDAERVIHMNHESTELADVRTGREEPTTDAEKPPPTPRNV